MIFRLLVIIFLSANDQHKKDYERSAHKCKSYGWLTTENDVRLIDFFAVARTSDTSGLYLAAPNFNEWDNQLRNCASIYKEIGISEEDNLITLSTCTSAEGNSRTILVGKIIESRKDDV